MASIVFGTYEPIEREAFPNNSDPNIIDIEWLNENGSPIGTKKINGVDFSDIMYGEKVRVKVKFQNYSDNRQVFIAININNKNISAYKPPIPVMKVKNNEALSEAFYLPITLYQDEIEEYDYNNHYTKTSVPQELYVTVSVRTTLKSQPNQILKPYTYFRNYEELVGLFKNDNSGEKDFTSNYENQFIGYDSSIKSIVDDFVAKITDIQNISDEVKIDEQVRISAKALWDTAVSSQSGDIDDRPLYWARNKMQVYLKRHPIFKGGMDFEKSLPNRHTPLSRCIKLFEELSRNYTGIDFSNAGSKKKVLITGFDPFSLNQFNNPLLRGNIKQSNPSGVIALALANNGGLGAYIQTMIVPVRYTDFDSSQENNKGQGEGIIEKHINNLVSQVDMIVTVSQYLPNENVIDVFGTSRRGGFNDNMDFTREDGTQSLPTSYEWIQTTLPKEFGEVQGIKFNWRFNGINHNPNTFPKTDEKLNKGSGGNYLSNEIFYRVAKLRKENRPNLKTGHFHVEMLQGNGEDLDKTKIENLINLVKKGLIEAIKTL